MCKTMWFLLLEIAVKYLPKTVYTLESIYINKNVFSPRPKYTMGYNPKVNIFAFI